MTIRSESPLYGLNCPARNRSDFVGKTFGRYRVLRFAGSWNSNAYWLVVDQDGNETKKTTAQLRKEGRMAKDTKEPE